MIKSTRSAVLGQIPKIKHGFYLRHGGVSQGDFASLNCSQSNADRIENVIENRRRVAVDLGVEPRNLVTCKQVHSPDVVVVDSPWDTEASPEADGLVTKQKGIALGALSADCVTILFCDEEAGVIAAAHAGWRGALAGVVEQTIKTMVKQGADRSKIVAALGASIFQESYEVTASMKEEFIAHENTAERFFKEGRMPGRYMFDLPGYVQYRAMSVGIKECELSAFDTYVDKENYFSCRRSAHKGKRNFGCQISVIVMVE